MTVSLGEWDQQPTNDPPAPAAAGAAIKTAIASLGVNAFVQDAARAALRQRLQTVAAAAVDDVLDHRVLTQLRQAADTAARHALQEPATTHDETPSELYFPDLLTFVRDYLAPMYRRSLNGPGVTWCPQWWKHAEAIARLEALWRAWEYLRQDPHTGMSLWFRDHADHHMNVLLNADGPLKGCKQTRTATASTRYRTQTRPTTAPLCANRT